MKVFSKVLAGLGAVVLTAFLISLPDLSMAQVPGVTVVHGHCIVVSR